MSDNEFISTTSTITEIQTPENTAAPFEEVVEKNESPQPVNKSKKRKRLTSKQRAAKIASGWNPPGPRPLSEKELDSALDELQRALAPTPSRADVLLKSLVDKLVALENDAQYRSVWLHFFTHGGVFSGPRYLTELQEAIQYLIVMENKG